MISVTQFRELIVRPALQSIGLYSISAEELVLGTALQESRLTYIKQLGRGPALGFFQMEPATFSDIWVNYLKYNRALGERVEKLAITPATDPNNLIYSLPFAAAMCRVHYLRVPEALPEQGDYEGQAEYWKEHYNTFLGAGTEEGYLESWLAYSGVRSSS